MEKRELILNGNINKVILSLAGPIMLNNFIQTIYNLTDTLWVSRLGGTPLAAMTLVWPVIFFLMSLGMGINVAGTSLISQYTGANNQERATQVAGQLIVLALLFSTSIGIVGFFMAKNVVIMMGGQGQLLEQASTYLKIMFLGIPAIFLFMAFTAIKQGQGDTVTPMKYGAFSVSLNIILDPILIFSFNLGIAGAAIATVFARAIFTFYAIKTLFSTKQGIKISLKDLTIKSSFLSKIIKIGLPSSVGQSTAALGFIILNVFIISFGQNTMAAFGIGNRINSLILMPAMGIGSALATIVGQNLGANQVQRARKAVKASTILTTSFLLIGGWIIFPFIPQIINFFTTNEDIAQQATFYLRLIVLTMPLMGFFQIFIGTFQGSGHTFLAMFLMTGRLWVLRIPMIILFKNYTYLGSRSVWYAMILSNTIISLAGLIIYLTGTWQKKVISSPKGAV